MFLPRKILERKLQRMLAEDLGEGDITTSLTVPPNTTVEANVVSRESGVVAGIEESIILLENLGLRAEALSKDGDEIDAGKVIIKISGDAKTMLATERTLLNLLSRMSGIASATRKLVKTIQKAKLTTKVACTRKTAPGLLYFDKKAVLAGGGDTHRLHLDDMILIKDNHIAVAGSLEKALSNAKKKASFSKKIEVEVSTAMDALEAAKSGADIIMLDNFQPRQLEEAVRLLKEHGCFGKVLLEASGGITAKNMLAYASKQVAIVSLGEITESAKALDISLEIVGVKRMKEHASTRKEKTSSGI
jgi:nicotinate-nucleotide pyrophosphorylase (carboxylating)